MKYIVASRKQAEALYMNLAGHRMNDTVVILNEKEVMNCKRLAALPTLEEKAIKLTGNIYTSSELKKLINEGLSI